MNVTSLIDLAKQAEDHPRIARIRMFPHCVFVKHTAHEDELHLIDRGGTVEFRHFNRQGEIVDASHHKRDVVPAEIRAWGDL